MNNSFFLAENVAQESDFPQKIFFWNGISSQFLKE